MPLLNPFTPEIIIVDEARTIDQNEYDRIAKYLDVEHWKCPKCGSTVFGRTLICPFNQKGEYCRTRRPD